MPLGRLHLPPWVTVTAVPPLPVPTAARLAMMAALPAPTSVRLATMGARRLAKTAAKRRMRALLAKATAPENQ